LTVAEGQEKEVTILGSKVQLENQNGKDWQHRIFVFTEVRPYVSFKVKLNDFIAEKYPGTEKVRLSVKLFKIQPRP
jgi:hypothetical protein